MFLNKKLTENKNLLPTQHPLAVFLASCDGWWFGQTAPIPRKVKLHLARALLMNPAPWIGLRLTRFLFRDVLVADLMNFC